MTDAATDLAGRLSEAEQAERPLAEEVNRLVAERDAAAQRQDFAAAAETSPKLDQARQELAIASATTAALRGALAALEQQRANDARALQIQQQQAEHRRRLAEVQRAENEALDEAQQELATMWAGVKAVQSSLLAALTAEHRAGDLRAEVLGLRVQLGEAEPGRTSRPNAVSARVEQNPMLASILRWRP